MKLIKRNIDMKRLLPFVLALLTLLFPALASAQNQKGKITINQVEHCVLTVTYYNDLLEEVTVNSGDLVPIKRMITAIPTLDSGYEIECYVVNGKEVVGSNIAKEVVLVDFEDGFSTTNIINKIKG